MRNSRTTSGGAGPEAVLAVPPAVFRLLPERLLRKHQAFPVRFEGTPPQARLVVAMVNPADLAAVDELRFAAGLPIVPVGSAPEIVAGLLTLHLGGPPWAQPAGASGAIDLPEDTGNHALPESWLVPLAPGGIDWQ